jgi:hypothetical protein
MANGFEITFAVVVDEGRLGYHHYSQSGNLFSQIRRTYGTVFNAMAVAISGSLIQRILDSQAGSLNGIFF